MPLASIHLVRLSPNSDVAGFTRKLAGSSLKPLVVSRCVRWIIKPERLSVSPLLEVPWDLFIVLPKSSSEASADLLARLRNDIADYWTMTVGIPSRVMDGFARKNDRLLHPRSGDVPELTGSMNDPRVADSAQGLELNQELLTWSKTFELGQNGAVSMFNLLAFRPEKGADESYRRYGKAFGESIGRRRGGDAKLVGKVVSDAKSQHEDKQGWEEFALAHYPSIRHFVDMLASKDYQEVNHQDRLPSLRDTCILCTTELDPELYTSRSNL